MIDVGSLDRLKLDNAEEVHYVWDRGGRIKDGQLVKSSLYFTWMIVGVC